MKDRMIDASVSFEEAESLPAAIEVVIDATDVEVKAPMAGSYILGGNKL